MHTSTERLRPSEAIVIALLLVVAAGPVLLVEGFPVGDGHSHAYNAWLARRIGESGVDNVRAVPHWTNAAYDKMLAGLMALAPPRAAAAAGHAVVFLAFSAAASFFVRRTAGRVSVASAAIIAMLSHGWVMHAGFSNFVVSTACVLIAIGIATSEQMGGWQFAGLSVAAACAAVAHPLPVVWLGACVAFLWSRRIWSSPWIALLVGSAVVLFFGLAVRMRYATQWSPVQLRNAFGVDQLYVFDRKYVLVAALGGAVGVAKLIADWRAGANAGVPNAVAFAGIAAVMTVTMPGAIDQPGLPQIGALSSRWSLATGVAWCAAAGLRPWSRRGTHAVLVTAVVFFTCLAVDWSVLCGVQRRLNAAVRDVGTGVRVVAPMILDTGGSARNRSSLLMAHAIDGACLGHCLSYGNYEPAARVFTVRCEGSNPWVLCDMKRTEELQEGRFVPAASEPPFLFVESYGDPKDPQFRLRGAKVGSAIPPIRISLN